MRMSCATRVPSKPVLKARARRGVIGRRGHGRRRNLRGALGISARGGAGAGAALARKKGSHVFVSARGGNRGRLPKCELRLVENVGHYSLPIRHMHEILADLIERRTCVRSSAHFSRALAHAVAETQRWKILPQARPTSSLRGVNHPSIRLLTNGFASSWRTGARRNRRS